MGPRLYEASKKKLHTSGSSSLAMGTRVSLPGNIDGRVSPDSNGGADPAGAGSGAAALAAA